MVEAGRGSRSLTCAYTYLVHSIGLVNLSGYWGVRFIPYLMPQTRKIGSSRSVVDPQMKHRQGMMYGKQRVY